MSILVVPVAAVEAVSIVIVAVVVIKAVVWLPLGWLSIFSCVIWFLTEDISKVGDDLLLKVIFSHLALVIQYLAMQIVLFAQVVRYPSLRFLSPPQYNGGK